MSELIVLSTAGMQKCAADIAVHLKANGVCVEHHALTEQVFPESEVWMQAPHSVRHRAVCLVADLRWPDPNTGIMRTSLIIDMLTRASVGPLHLVVPYIPYMRQDRKDKPRVPISARRVADMLELGGRVSSIITFDLHADQEEGYFTVPVDHLRGDLLFANYYKALLGERMENVIILAPDIGSSKRAQRFAERMNNVPLAIVDKRRSGPDNVTFANFIGPERLDGMEAILFDDICASARTLVQAAKIAYERGAAKVRAAVTHGQFTDGAEERLRAAGIEVAVLRTIPRNDAYIAAHPHITHLPIGPFLADVLYQNVEPNGSVSKLFA